ncbi:hypothetical protein LV84_04000 [Algoriphagus ratkowskyi]|uniref:Uncharacterized protein n=1 Tax=Algoriphagus ratkowskyi TaxID=57028 RepID=A0A2W7QPF2_9BACT|nr:hypothetical protein LV84_04000 [Algoriphagus ratkowskyi]
MNLNGLGMCLKESRAISKKTYTNFCPQTGSSTGPNRFSEIPNPKHMGSSDGYEVRLYMLANRRHIDILKED